MRDVRIWVVGLGTVGQWLLREMKAQAPRLTGRYGFSPKLVGVANARDGFVYDSRGLDIQTVLQFVSKRRSLSELDGVQHWPSSTEGLAATDADVLVEVTASSADNGEPGITHMRDVLRRGISVHGLAGTTPLSLRGIVNATANFILTRMEQGSSYESALSEAQHQGLAERDPTADVDGYDAMAKTMILAGLLFGIQLRPESVARRGISTIERAEISSASAEGARVKELVTLELFESSGSTTLSARVEPTLIPNEDPLARVSGVANAVVCRAQPVGEVMVTGPGAGPELAGQGVLSDLIATASWSLNR
jgi:homoserine dehydrogenase